MPVVSRTTLELAINVQGVFFGDENVSYVHSIDSDQILRFTASYLGVQYLKTLQVTGSETLGNN